MATLQKSVRTIVRRCLNLQPKEFLIIVAHDSVAEIAAAVLKAARRITKNIISINYLQRNAAGPELPESVIAALVHSDAAIVITPNHISEYIFDQARQNGSRVIVLQNASVAMMERMFETNLNKASNLSRKLADLFSIGKFIEINSASGTRLELSIARVMGIAETGMAKAAGELSSLPAGKATIALNDNIEGKLCLDRIAGVRKKLNKPLLLNISKGHITQIKGKAEAEMLRKDIRKFGRAGRMVTEFGIGTNSLVKFGNSAQEDEKCLGSVYFCFGRDRITSGQGKVQPAIKGIVVDPTVIIDGRPIMENGKILV